jgi:hypothetical protein
MYTFHTTTSHISLLLPSFLTHSQTICTLLLQPFALILYIINTTFLFLLFTHIQLTLLTTTSTFSYSLTDQPFAHYYFTDIKLLLQPFATKYRTFYFKQWHTCGWKMNIDPWNNTSENGYI